MHTVKSAVRDLTERRKNVINGLDGCGINLLAVPSGFKGFGFQKAKYFPNACRFKVYTARCDRSGVGLAL
jgi:hypothetical protein